MTRKLSPLHELDRNPWQILDVGSVWMKEFASALSSLVPAISWEPEMTKFGALERWTRVEQIADPPLTVHRFPLQRGYARSPLRWLLPYERKLLPLLKSHCIDAAETALIVTTPYYAPLAERWPGKLVYYATDLTYAYHGVNPQLVNRLDRRLCNAAHAVCPNSKRIAEYFVAKCGCDPARITVVPNATREGNVASAPLLAPQPLPPDAVHLSRPIAGVIGNLSGNMDWLLLAEAIRLTPSIAWLFVGPTLMPIQDPKQSAARAWVQQHAHFVGSKPYAQLQAYARSFDVAILPYMKKEPTYSGSSTRFYEHLAACRPMIATRGFAELLEKPPLVTLVDTASQLQSAIHDLEQKGFNDGYETGRWQASKAGTWQARAQTVIDALHRNLP